MSFGDEVQGQVKSPKKPLLLDKFLADADDRDDIEAALSNPKHPTAALWRALTGRGYAGSEASVRNWRIARGVR